MKTRDSVDVTTPPFFGQEEEGKYRHGRSCCSYPMECRYNMSGGREGRRGTRPCSGPEGGELHWAATMFQREEDEEGRFMSGQFRPRRSFPSLCPVSELWRGGPPPFSLPARCRSTGKIVCLHIFNPYTVNSFWHEFEQLFSTRDIG